MLKNLNYKLPSLHDENTRSSAIIFVKYSRTFVKPPEKNAPCRKQTIASETETIIFKTNFEKNPVSAFSCIVVYRF